MQNYSSQILAVQAAGSINGDGTTPITYGCSLTRFSSGVYKLILPTGEGVIDAQSFTRVTTKPPYGSLPVAVVSDESFHIKTISIYDNAGGSQPDCSIEVLVQRSTVNPY